MRSKELVSDELWHIIEPLLPTEPYKARGGRPRIPDRAVLSGIDFVLRSGKVDWSRASLDSASVSAKRGAKRLGPAPPTVVSPAPSITS